MTDKREGYSRAGDGPSTPPAPPTPSGYQEPGIAAVEAAYGPYEGNLGRILDPVRAAALHEAVFGYRHFEEDEDDPIGEILAVATRFEAWLAGTDEATP